MVNIFFLKFFVGKKDHKSYDSILGLMGLHTLVQKVRWSLENEKLGLETILEWKMSLEEGEVFHIALTYEHEYKRIFAEESDGQAIRRNSLPRRSDPRRSNLYRQCWKLRRETRGLIEQHEYKNYIHANLFIIKINGGHVEPNCITGDKAWIRYKVWKRRYDQKMADIGAQIPPPSVSTTNPKIIAEIDRTRKFLFEKCDGSPTFEKIKKFIESGVFRLWVATSRVSPYYLTLSPFVEKTNLKDSLFSVCNSSEALIREKITQEIKDYFNHEYKYEL
jgi:hypothetical protein